jgi:regulator of extracellular matrix RemA (YlzA/DUF370 family)
MMKPVLDIGFSNYLFPSQVVVILNPDSQPTKRIVQEAKNTNKVFDIRQGKKLRAVIVLKTGEIVLSAITARTIKNRYLEYANKVNINSTNNHYIDPFLEIGFDNYVLPDNVGAIFNPNSQPIIRLIKDAKTNNRCFDVRQGKKTRSALVLNSGEVIISAIDPKTIRHRYLKYINKVNLYSEKEADGGDSNE